MTDVKIPPLGESISSGVLAKWHVKDGDVVTRGQPLFELETDKITSEGQAEVAGRVALKVVEGTEVTIGQIVAVIDETALAASTPAGTQSPAQVTAKSDVPLSPAVRRVAAETHVDPSTIKGTGKGGRVTKGDLMMPISTQDIPGAPSQLPKIVPPADGKPEAPKPAVSSPQTGVKEQTSTAGLLSGTSGGSRVTRTKLSPLRKRIAERLVAAQRTAAILTTFNEVDMSAVMALRKKHQDDFVARHGVKLGFMSFFVKAAVDALKAVPAVNAQLEGDELVQNHYFDIGVAVGTERGLIVPVVRDCDRLSFAGIEKAIGVHAKNAREGKIKIEDMQGGVFTISNGGIYGSMLSTPILNPPQSGILGLHNIVERAVVVGGAGRRETDHVSGAEL